MKIRALIKSKIKINFLFFISLYFLQGTLQYAHSDCTIVPYIPRITNFSFGTINIKLSQPVGSIIAQTRINESDMSYSNKPQCIGRTTFGWRLGIFQVPINFVTYYATNVPGVGISMYGYTSLGSGNGWVPYTTDNDTGSSTWTLTGGPAMTVRLIKTGVITPGHITDGVIATHFMNHLEPVAVRIVGSRVTTSMECSIDSKFVSVNMGTVRSDDFQGIGSTTSPISFRIRLKCEGAEGGVKVSGKLTGIKASGYTSVLKLNQASSGQTATGVGVQVLYNNSPVILDQSYTGIIGTPPDSSLSPYNLDIPLTARYFKISDRITPGSANSTATFTLKFE